MRIVIKETGEEKCLSLIDPKNNMDWADDLIGNYGELGRLDNPDDRDRAFLWDKNIDAYICERENFDWWANVIAQYQEFDFACYDLAKKYGRDAVDDALGDELACDLEDQPARGLAALRDAFPDDF